MKTYEKLNTSQQNTVDSVYKHFGSEEVSQPEYIKYCQDNKLTFCFLLNKDYRVSKGLYKLPLPNQSKQVDIPEVKQEIIEQPQVNIGTTNNKAENIIPTKDETFVPFGHYKDIKNIIKSKVFYPSFITGLSGNGKTFNVQQSCANTKRECIRVNITIETDEDDLLGGYRLQDGQTVWQNGPVIEAMERGAILLLDEIDLASNKIMCLQPILEGNGVFIKKINKFVKPAPGFNVIATANTKGQGSEDGKFIGTNILNEAFLERFPITIEQSYPSNKNEIKMLENVMTQKGLTKDIDKKFADNLITWADIIRKTFYEGGVDEIISTRRLVHIVDAYAIFKDKMKSIQMCTNRFDNDTKTSFIDLYTKIDGGEDVSNWSNTSETEEQDSDDSEEGNVSY